MYLTFKNSICFSDAEGGDPVEVETPILNETTLLANEAEAFALEPVAITRRHKNLFLQPQNIMHNMQIFICTNTSITLLKPHFHFS